jgi:hypothetical protein
LESLRRTFGEEFGEVLFSILAVEEQIPTPESSQRSSLSSIVFKRFPTASTGD